MSDMQPTRKGSPPIKVYCLPAEKAEIAAMARASGNSLSNYLRLVGQGYRVYSKLDYAYVRELAKINGDLGRLGGLLKLWLTDDVKLAAYDPTNLGKTIVGTLAEIQANQAAIREVMTMIVTPRSER